MRIVYICSPYRAADEETLHCNIESAGARDGACSRARNNSEM